MLTVVVKTRCVYDDLSLFHPEVTKKIRKIKYEVRLGTSSSLYAKMTPKTPVWIVLKKSNTPPNEMRLTERNKKRCKSNRNILLSLPARSNDWLSGPEWSLETWSPMYQWLLQAPTVSTW